MEAVDEAGTGVWVVRPGCPVRATTHLDRKSTCQQHARSGGACVCFVAVPLILFYHGNARAVEGEGSCLVAVLGKRDAGTFVCPRALFLTRKMGVTWPGAGWQS